MYACAHLGTAFADFRTAELWSPDGVSRLATNLSPITSGAVYSLSYYLQNTYTSPNNFTSYGISSWTASLNGGVVDYLLGPPANWPDYMLRTVLWTAPAGVFGTELSFGFQQVFAPADFFTACV
jgi:hypothetical protein